MPELQTREARVIVALAAIMKNSGFERNYETDELEPFVKFKGDLADITGAVIAAIDET